MPDLGTMEEPRLVHAMTEEIDVEGDWKYNQVYYENDGIEAWSEADECAYDTYWQEEDDTVFFNTTEADELLFDTEEFDQIYVT